MTIPSANPADRQLRYDLETAGDRLYVAAQFAHALPKYLEAVQLHPTDAGLHFKVALAAWGADQLGLAEQYFLSTIQLDSNHAAARGRLALLYIGLDQIDAALEQIAIARRLEPENDEHALVMVNALERSGSWREAWVWLEPILARNPNSSQAAVLFSRLAARVGRQSDAAALVQRLAKDERVSAFDRYGLAFAGVRLLDSMGRYDDAFALARLGNQLSGRSYNPRLTREGVDRQINLCTRQHLRALPRAEHGSCRPVFIVGMPRSGTSHVEQILSAHPQIHGAGELADIPRMVEAMSKRTRYPECLDTCSLNTFNRMAQEYLSVLERLAPKATYVTDKLPLNCLYLDLIQCLFPDCHVIHCVRDPLDTCLSCFMTGFSVANAWSCNLTHLGLFYREYERLMKHWKEVIDLPIYEVRYEELVTQLDEQTGRLLNFLGLPWDDRCLRFFESKRAVTTASRDQVTRPIYQSSVGRWKSYQAHLGELIAALGPSATAPPPPG